MGYTKEVVRGISWVTLQRGLLKVLVFVKTALLARILTPTQFGVFGIATLILGLLEIITETGINIFLVQEDRKDSIEHYLNTAWIVSIIRGLILGVIIWISAPLISNFFNNPDSLSVIRLMAMVPVIRGFINPSLAGLQKNLNFRKEFWFKSGISLVEICVAITLSFLLRSSISLVWSLIVAAVAEVIASHRLLNPKPKLIFEREKWNLIIHQGKWVLSAGVLSYMTTRGPSFLVGKLLSTTALGLYDMAYNLSTLAATEISDIFNRVTFPVYVRIINDKPRCRKAFIKNVILVTALILPPTLFLFLFPKPIVDIVLGNQWLMAVSLIKLMAVFGFVATVGGAVSPLLLAAKHQNFLSHITAFQMLVLAIIIVPFIREFGAHGAGYALILAMILASPLKVWYVYQVLK